MGGFRCTGVLGVLAGLTGVALGAQAWALSTALAAVVLHGAGVTALRLPLAVLLTAVLARSVLAWATETMAARAAAGAKEELRAQLLDHALALGPEWIDDPGRGPAALTALATTGLDGLDAYVTRYLPALVTACVVPVEIGAGILLADPTSALLIAATVPLIPLFAWLIGRYTQLRAERAADATARLSRHLQELVRALPVLTAFRRAAAQTEAVRRVDAAHRKATSATLRVAFLSALALELISTLSVALVAVGIGLRLVDGGLALATGLFVLILAPECYLPLRAAGAAHHASEDGLEALRRCEEVLAQPIRVPAPKETCVRGGPVPKGVQRDHHGTAAPSVVISGLSVDRRTTRAPQRLSLVVRPGAITHLDSPSGSGKSSTFAVLLGFATPAEGTVTVDGADLSTMDIEAWRRRIAWVPQRPAFIGGTVTEELGLAVADQPGGAASAAELRAVAVECAAEHLLARPVDALSTGERQRVAVARALLRVRRGAGFLLLDEPTAHLDPASATTVHAAIRAAADRGVAVLLAAHRTVAESSADSGPRRAVVAAEAVTPARTARLRGLVDRRLLAGALLGAGALGSGAALTGTAAWLIATAAGRPPLLTLSVAIVAVRTFGLSRAALRYAERLVTHDAAFRLAGRVRVGLWEALVRLGPARLLGLRRSDGLQRLVDDTDTIRELVPRVVQPPLVAAIVGAAIVTAQTLILPAAGAVLAAALLIAGVGGAGAALAAERRSSTRLAAGRRTVAAAVLGLLDAAPDLIATGAQRGRRQALAAADVRLGALARRQALAAGVAAGLGTAAIGLAVLGCTALGAAAAASGRLAPVLVPVLALLPLAAAEAVAGLPSAATQLGALRAAAGRLHELLAEPEITDPAITDPSITDPATTDPAPQRPGGTIGRPIHVPDIKVRWPGAAEPALRGVHLTVPPGARVVVLGPSGAGKSTLLALLLGFLPIENKDARLPERVAWCPQEPQLVSTTIRENLRLADPDATDDDLRAALHTAALDTWADRLDVVLGIGGAAVSGGEAQRLALARAVLGARHADVLLLDEPTAHLDEATAVTLLRRVRTRFPAHTIVHVTHRAEEAADADLVVEIRDGELRVREPSITAATAAEAVPGSRNLG